MNFPACKHRQSAPATAPVLGWVAAEPFRVFFISGALWSLMAVWLWPMFYAGDLGYYPALSHGRLMIQGFCGAFVIGFLGTAGPRMASAPKLTVLELLALMALHLGGAICHLRLQHRWGDGVFALLLVSLLVMLGTRVIRHGKERPPPQMLLALTGLLCGSAGAVLFLFGGTWSDPQRLRLAGLLLNQGLLLPPVLGIGSFIFPRILGAGFGEPATEAEARTKGLRAATAAALLVASFFVDAFGWPAAGGCLRAATAGLYLWLEVRWRRTPSDGPRGSMAGGLLWCLITGFGGLLFAGFYYVQHIAIEHLLYVGGFGLLIYIVASRVLFGHSGDLEGFAKKSWMGRLILFLGLLAAYTRMSPALLPTLTVSHHLYAAWTWALLSLLWLVWHRRRFFKKDDE